MPVKDISKTFYFFVKIAYFLIMNHSSVVYVLHNSFEKNHYVPAHSHTCYELIFYLKSPVYVKFNSIHQKAKGTFDFDASLEKPTKIKLEPNSFIIISPNVAHDELHLNDNSVMCVGFTYNGSEDLDHFSFKQTQDEKIGIRLILEQICDEFLNKKYGFEDYMNNLLDNLMLTLFRSTKQELGNTDELKYVEQYIKQNIGRNLSISSLAEMSGYSISHFRRVFKEYTGSSPKRYIANERKNVAKKLIANTSLSLNEIGESVGFSDYYQFATFYKKECGISPGRDRKKNQVL